MVGPGTIPKRTLIGVQYLRALAALMVVIFHLQVRLVRAGSGHLIPSWLSAGVDIFFVVSGLIMWVSTCEDKLTPSQFIYHRLVRIVPPYWLITLFMVAMMLVAPALVAGGVLNLPHIIASLFFIPWLHPVMKTLEPVVPMGWTLNYEMFFYAIFALGMFLKGAARLAIISTALIAIVIVGALLKADPIVGFYTSPIILEFMLGMLVGWFFMSKYSLPVGLSGVVVVVSALAVPLLTMAFPHAQRAFIWGPPALGIVGGVTQIEKKAGMFHAGLLKLLGDSSYSLYLTHGITLTAMAVLWQKLHLFNTKPTILAFIVAGPVAAVIVGILVYQFAEDPMRRLFKRWIPANRLNHVR
jgi:exopolysaccharide production protein ExoZ